MSVSVFATTDAPYLEWMQQHPKGYVLNTARRPNSGFLVLHASGCHHISSHLKQAENAFTAHDYIKVCSEGAMSVYHWALENRASVTSFRVCQTCQPDFTPPEPLGDDQTVADLEEIAGRLGIKPTQRETLIKARLGQGTFRTQMLELWGGKCAVTGLTIQSALIASHAKRWADSSDEERLDPHNGLPLIATLDRLFDQYLIAFDPNTGKMLISDDIGEADRVILGIPANLRKAPDERQALYLKLHFDIFETKNPS